VVPTFKRQIASGGPVMVSHPDMTRYFMTIPEAVQLVLQSSVLGKGGEVFMLDMGEPVKIVDLARDLIELSGLEVGHDIDIVYTGVRPGEKLYEELFIDGETYEATGHAKVRSVKNASAFIPAVLDDVVQSLVQVVEDDHGADSIACLQVLIPEFTPDPRRWAADPKTIHAVHESPASAANGAGNHRSSESRAASSGRGHGG
jgi:FlaA1/EpsC-like NDP-sugar epimerase